MTMMIDNNNSNKSASALGFKTPPRSSNKKRTASLISASSTPSVLQTPSRRLRRRATAIFMPSTSRMSPSPSLMTTTMRTRSCSSTMMPSSNHRYASTSNSTTLTPASSRTGDRFIPSRRRMNIDLCRRTLLLEDDDDEQDRNQFHDNDNGANSNSRNHSRTRRSDPVQQQQTPVQKEYKRRMLSSLCDVPLESLDENGQPKSLFAFGGSATRAGDAANGQENNQSSHSRSRLEDPYSQDILRVLQMFETTEEGWKAGDRNESHGMSTNKRVIPSKATKVVGVPDLVNDFYLNLISWSEDNILAIGLGRSVYLLNVNTDQVGELMTTRGGSNYVTSVAWCTKPGQSKYLAIGTNAGTVQLWDTQALRRLRKLQGHHARVDALAWSHQWLTTAGKDSLILQHDLRSRAPLVATYEAHHGEVCGLKWNEEGTALASGANDNLLCIWDAAMSDVDRRRRNNPFASTKVAPRLLLKEHKAAVKALDWCPFQRGILASGGGATDETIKIWNADSGTLLSSTKTGSQVCSLLWNQNERELCSAHGFSDNQLTLWKYGGGGSSHKQHNLSKMKDLTGHTQRVLGMACSPDKNTVVSIGDETLRFWDLFGATPKTRSSSVLLPLGELSFGTPIR